MVCEAQHVYLPCCSRLLCAMHCMLPATHRDTPTSFRSPWHWTIGNYHQSPIQGRKAYKALQCISPTEGYSANQFTVGGQRLLEWV